VRDCPNWEELTKERRDAAIQHKLKTFKLLVPNASIIGEEIIKEEKAQFEEQEAERQQVGMDEED
jgi:hypothetical protein